MTVEYSLKTFSDIYTAAMEHARQDLSDEELIQRLKRLINIRYSKVQAYAKWPWRKIEESLFVPKYYSGTSCSITNLTRTLTVADVITQEVATDWVGRRVFISSDKEIYKIVALQSYASGNTKFILNQAYVASTRSAVTFKVFQDEFAMPPDFSDFDDVVSFYNGKEVVRVGSDKIMRLYNASPKRSGRAMCVSTVGTDTYDGIKMSQFVMGQMFLGGFEGAKKIKIYPAMYSEDYILPITYVREIQSLINDEDEPLMDTGDCIILFYGAVADLYSYLKDAEESAKYEAQFNDKLMQMLTANKEDQDRPKLQIGVDYRKGTNEMSSSLYEFDSSEFEMN